MRKFHWEELCSLSVVELRRQAMYLCCIEDNSVDIYCEAEVLSSASRSGRLTPTPGKEPAVPSGWEAGWTSVPVSFPGRTRSFTILTMMELRFLSRSLVTLLTELSHRTTVGWGDQISKFSSFEEGRFILRWRKRNNIPCTKISQRAVDDTPVRVWRSVFLIYVLHMRPRKLFNNETFSVLFHSYWFLVVLWLRCNDMDWFHVAPVPANATRKAICMCPTLCHSI
jgi:hypothetical protein